ncbi:phage tail protein [Kosakonia sacchari]|uniref:phage tail protein n=1 Tax=Kosakonia sacchari TaxID=1158459 RepID=UPI000BE54C4F|nr:phage tail protein [Kosakonia sacchari]PDO88609.1 phage tail protein [Kosakonia sacchari]
MTAKFFAILTNQGAALLANATALGTKLNITQMAVGDGNGTLPTPDATQTKLVNQKRIAPLNMLSVDANNASQIIAEQVIPENEGGFWIREIGLYDDNGVLIAVANCPETYKPQLQEGSGRTQTIRMVLIVSSTAAVTLKIDPSVVLATRQYVDNAVIEVKAYTDNLLKQHIADSNPHKQYAPVASPVFTGKPRAPTPDKSASENEIATAAFVQAAIASLVSGIIAQKQPLDNTLTALSGKDVAELVQYLGLSDVVTRSDDWYKRSLQNIFNLADLTDIPGARGNLGLGNSATKDTGTTAGTVAAGNDPRLVNALNKTFNLSDLTDVAGARNNLGLGAAAVKSIGTGVGQIPDMTAWRTGNTLNDYMMLPNGIYVQWYTADLSAGSNVINFPIPFPNFFLADAAMPGNANPVWGGSANRTSRVYQTSANNHVCFIALGL